MRVVLVGGLGFLGYHLASEAIECCEVVVAGRRASVRGIRRRLMKEMESMGVKVRFAEDRLTKVFLEDLSGDVYVHVAGKISGSYRSQWEAHVGLLSRVIDAASSLGSRVVYISSILAYGRVRGLSRGSRVVEEDEHLTGERDYRSYHSRTKAEGERLLKNRSQDLGGKWCILRPGLLVGAWGYHIEWRLSKAMASLSLYPSAGFRLNVVPARDVARVALRAFEGELDGAWVHLAPHHPTLGEMYGMLCKMVRNGRECTGVPIGTIITLTGPLAPPSTSLAAMWEGLDAGYIFDSRVLKDFEWTPLEESVREFVEWAKST